MLSFMPKKLIKSSDLNNWEKYSKNLEKISFVNNYLGATLKEWVRSSDNPLSISLVERLYNNNLDSFNNNLAKMEKSIGKDNLSDLFHELSLQRGSPAGINTKIDSLFGEIYCYSELDRNYNKVVKIKEIGDWLCDENIFISVKTKNDLNFNLEIIENTLRSLYYIKENNILREYNNIKVRENKNIDDKFRNNILWFLNSELVKFINFQDNQLERWNNLRQEARRYFFENNEFNSYLNLEVEFFKGDNKKNIISFLLREDRIGEKESLEHLIKIIFKESSNKKTLSILFDTDTWWGDPEIRWLDLKDSINSYLEKFDKCHSYIIRKNKNFIGWINIFLHAKHENYSLKTNEIMKDVKNIIGKKEYKIILALVPRWNSLKPNIIELF